MKQEKRQELVDDSIDTMLNRISLKGEWQWDPAVVGELRDIIFERVFKPRGISATDFYPGIL